MKTRHLPLVAALLSAFALAQVQAQTATPAAAPASAAAVAYSPANPGPGWYKHLVNLDFVKKQAAIPKIDGVMLRVLGSKNGKPYLDPMFEENYAACTSRGIPVGGYYYTCAVTPRQTAEELTALRAALEGKTFQYPLAIDVESAGLRVLAPEALAARVAEAAAQLEAWNLYAMVYTYTNFADTALAMDALTAYDLWLADYRGKCPTRPHGMWQYTSKGRVAGIDGPVDLSDAAKDYPAICKRTGLGTFQAG